MAGVGGDVRRPEEEAQHGAASFRGGAGEVEAGRRGRLPLIQIGDDDIPFMETEDESILYYIGQLRQIIQKPMIDLSEHSNTDLKLAYGVGNFKTLSEYDENFNTFLVALTNLARSYERSGYHDEAEQTYLAAIRFGSRRVTDYEELAKIYLVTRRPDRVRSRRYPVCHVGAMLPLRAHAPLYRGYPGA